jgi:hypothetical protein
VVTVAMWERVVNELIAIASGVVPGLPSVAVVERLP